MPKFRLRRSCHKCPARPAAGFPDFLSFLALNPSPPLHPKLHSSKITPFFCAERDTFAPSIIVSSLQSQIASLLPSMSEQQAPQATAAATTPQQQPMGTPTQQNAPTPASVANSGGDQLTCQWQACGERLPSAEQLYVSPRLRFFDRYTSTEHQSGPRLRTPCWPQEH
jgi:hypothetical protein